MMGFSDKRREFGDDVANDGPAGRFSPNFYVRVRILNCSHVASAFGEEIAAQMVAAINRRAAALVCGIGFISVHGGGLDIIIDRPSAFLTKAQLDGRGALKALEQAFAVLGLAPILCDGDVTVFAAMIVAACPVADISNFRVADGVIEQAQARLDGLLRDRGPHLPIPDGTMRWAELYRDDMRLAALVYAAIADDGLFLTWQPILKATDKHELLYSEGLVRVIDPGRRSGTVGADHQPDVFLPALERLGLLRALDADVVRLTIARLHRDTDARLGCNISAHSAVLDGWWTDILLELADDDQLATRLTIGISGTAPLPTLAATLDFVRKLRRLGCRIAINGFGCGYLAISAVAALKPDIVRIDAFFLRNARLGDGQTTLGHLAALAQALAIDVVMDGVVDEAAERRAANAGALWLQGDFVAAPAMTLSVGCGR